MTDTLGARKETTQFPPSKRRRRIEAARAAAAAAAATATGGGGGDGAPAAAPKRHPAMATCPACGNGAKPDNMMRHLRACCPEHLRTPEAAPLAARADEERDDSCAAAAAAAAADGTAVPDALRALLEAVARQEALQRRRILKLTFMVEEREEWARQQQQQQQRQQQQQQQQQQGPPPPCAAAAAAAAPTATTNDDDPQPPERRPLPDVARLMVLPERRAARLLDRAMRTIEMPRDPDPGLRVLHECARFLAVAKPAGVATTPAHRWRGGSMVNRLLWYAGEERERGTNAWPAFEPRVLHRLDIDTSGVLLCAKDARAAAAGQAALAGRAGRTCGAGDGSGAEKTYVALAYGWPPPWTPCDSSPSGHVPPPPPGVTVVVDAGASPLAELGLDGVGGGGVGGGAAPSPLLAFDVDAAIGRHPDSAVGRRVAEDAQPSFAAIDAERHKEEEEEEDGGGGGSRRRGQRRGDDNGDNGSAAEATAFLPASTRFVVIAAAAEPPAAEWQRAVGGQDGDAAAVDPAPLACGASRAATLATFGPASSSAPPRQRCCLVLASLRTGRTHQIRLHLAHAGLPVAGDELYGCALRPLLPRQALHAWRLRVEAPAVPPAESAARARQGCRSAGSEGRAEGDGKQGEEEAAAASAAGRRLLSLDVRAPLPDDIVRAARALGVAPLPDALC